MNGLLRREIRSKFTLGRRHLVNLGEKTLQSLFQMRSGSAENPRAPAGKVLQAQQGKTKLTVRAAQQPGGKPRRGGGGAVRRA